MEIYHIRVCMYVAGAHSNIRTVPKGVIVKVLVWPFSLMLTR